MDQSPHEVKQKQSNPELVSTLNGKLPNYENNRSKSAKFIYLSTQSIFGCFSNLKVKGSSVKSLQLRDSRTVHGQAKNCEISLITDERNSQTFCIRITVADILSLKNLFHVVTAKP